MASRTWNGNISGIWTDPDNWDGGVPEAGDDIVITGQGFGPTAPPDTEAGSLSVQGSAYGGPIRVSTDFRWTDGDLECPIVIDLAATGRITVGSLAMAMDAVITNHGSLTVEGTGSLPAGNGAQFINDGVLVLGDAITWTHTGGDAIALINTGELTVAAPTVGPAAAFRTAGGVVRLQLEAGTVSVRGELKAGFGTELALAGATLAGAGTISATDSAIVEVASTTVLSDALTLHLENATFTTATDAPVDTRLQIDGTLLIGAGSLSGSALHLRRAGRLHLGPATTATFQSDFVLINDGRLDVAAGASLHLQGDATLRNNGTLTLHAPITVAGGRIANAGLVETVDAGTVDLVNTELVTFAAAPPIDPEARVGAIALRAGLLHVSGLAQFAMNSGGMYLLGGSLRCQTLELASGFLTGQGTITGTVSNNGWIDLPGPGLLTIDGQLANGAAGNLVVPAAAWLGARETALLTVTGPAVLGGSIWAPQSPVNVDDPLTLLTSPQISASFDRRRGVDWGVRLRAHTTSTAVEVRVERAPQGVFYGFDCSHYLEIRPGGTRADVDAYMGAVYENTPWSFFVMYIASPTKWAGNPFPRRVTQDATASLPTLFDQGWGIIPVYWGQNNYEGAPGSADDPPKLNPNLTDAQGTEDGTDAGNLADGAGIPHGRAIYLDIESITATLDPDRANDYVNAWITAVRNDGRYQPGVYCPKGFAAALLATHAPPPVWVGTPDQTINPIDEFGEIAPIDFSHQNLPVTVWQYRFNVSGDALRAAKFQFIDDRASIRRWTSTAPIDFDLAACLDPSQPTNVQLDKKPRAVVAVSTAAETMTGGNSTEATITLDRLAPQPLGTTIVMRSDQPEVQVPTIAHVDPGATSVTLPVTSSPVTHQVAIELRVRALHDLRSDPAACSLTLTNPGLSSDDRWCGSLNDERCP